MKNFINILINKLTHKNKWKLKLYLFNQYIKTVYVDENDNTVFRKVYIVKIFLKRHIFKTNFTMVALVPNKILFKDESKKEIHIETELYAGEVIK